MLVQEAKRRRRMGGGLYLYGVKEGVCSVLRKGGYLEEIGDENIFSSKAQALSSIYERLNREICRSCDKRIFQECVSSDLPGSTVTPITQASRKA